MNWIIGGLAAYGIAVGGLYIMQDQMIFPRAPAETPKYPLWPTAEDLTLQTADGQTIKGHLVRAPGDPKGLLLGFTGNAWNAQDCLTFIANRVRDWDVVVFHYRGYRPSTGEPSQNALFADALLIYDRITNALKPRKTLGLGFSLGSGVVSYLASERQLDGQVLFTPFDSIASVAKKRYRVVPVDLLIKHPFHSDLYQRQTQTPASVVLASDDKVVPRTHSEKLIASLANVVFLETIPDSTHGGIYDMPEVDDVLRRSIAKIDEVTAKPEMETAE